MIKEHHDMPLVNPSGESLSSRTDSWTYGDESFEYSRNKEGYRSEEFTKNPKYLFAGCSETFGESAKYETTWAYKLFNILKTDQDSYCNIGVPGIDVSMIIYHILKFIEKYGKPENLFVVFPQFNRIVRTTKYNVDSITFSIAPRGTKKTNPNVEFVNENTQECLNSVGVVQVKNLESMCNQLGINLFVGAWSTDANEKIKEEGWVDSYVDLLDKKEIADFMVSHNFDSSTLKRKDEVHHGEAFHSYWASKFYQKFIERKK
jgi:hypothetical protein